MSHEVTELEAFETWLKTKNVDDYEGRGRWNTRHAHMVIDWVIETNRNARKAFFGVSLGKDPHNNFFIVDVALTFWFEVKELQEKRQKDLLIEKMKDPTFSSDYSQGLQDGYWMQTKYLDTEGYLLGYSEGISIKQGEGYDVSETETGAYAINMG
jgi:hypothetical protein